MKSSHKNIQFLKFACFKLFYGKPLIKRACQSLYLTSLLIHSHLGKICLHVFDPDLMRVLWELWFDARLRTSWSKNIFKPFCIQLTKVSLDNLDTSRMFIAVLLLMISISSHLYKIKNYLAVIFVKITASNAKVKAKAP